MRQRIRQHLIANPSYFKWSEGRLAMKYNCSTRTIRGVMRNLENARKAYLKSLA